MTIAATTTVIDPAIDDNNGTPKQLQLNNDDTTTGTITGRNKKEDINNNYYHGHNTNYYLGDEPNLFDIEIEKDGVQMILAELTDIEKDEMPDITMPIRHLRAQKGNVEKAIESIRCTLQWRKEFGVDRIINYKHDNEMYEILNERVKTGIFYVRGYDKNGRAIICTHPEKQKLGNGTNEDDQIKHVIFALEKAIACTKRKSKEVSNNEYIKFIDILDYSKFKLSDSGPLSLSKRTIQIFQQHYPEMLHCAYIINPPKVFRIFWTFIKPFLDPDTKKKIVFCNTNNNIKKFTQIVNNINTLEAGYGGPTDNPVRPFDPKEYMELPFDVAFDE